MTIQSTPLPNPSAEHAGSTSPALSMRGLQVVYPDGTTAVSSVELDVGLEEFVSIVGPSGCGKSTLLRIAAGLLKPNAGTVHRSSTELGYVFQDATLLPWRTVTDNVGLLPELRRMPRKRRKKLVAEAIATVGLNGFEDRYQLALSGGMKMRVSLARALTLNPDIFLFDEPFGALDEMTRERLNDAVLELFRQRGFAGLFVTHSIQEATFLSTRVLVMSHRPGRIVADIPIDFDFPRPPKIRFDPAFTRVAGTVSDALRN